MVTSREVPQRIKNRIPIWSGNPTSGYLSKGTERILKRYLHFNVHWSTIHNSKIQKQPKFWQMNEWIKKMWYMHTIERYGDFKKENPEIPDNTDEP